MMMEVYYINDVVLYVNLIYGVQVHGENPNDQVFIQDVRLDATGTVVSYR